MQNPVEVRVISATGVCGSGFRESSFEAGLARNPHFIGCDAGSTDPGPAPLGTGKTSFSSKSMKRDLRIMMKGARKNKIPLLIGSAGSAGGDPHLEVYRQMAMEIAQEEGLKFRLALIHAEQKKDYLKKKLRDGRIRPLETHPDFDEGVIDRSERIVGMMGEEPFLKALDNGADIVIAGRSSDCAIFAGIPMKMGVSPGMAWHAAKLLECAAAVCVQRDQPDSVFVTFGRDHFDIEPLGMDMRCTPQSVASHALYENSDPYRLVESSGTLDLHNSKYEALTDRTVRVSGSQFEAANAYTIKLEGAEKVGYQSVVIGGIRDPYIIRQIDSFVERVYEKVHARVKDVYGDDPDAKGYIFNVRLYGKNGVMGPLEPVQEIRSHELGMVMEATARTQEVATSIAAMARHQALHLPIPEWSGLITGLACLYNPAYLERGAIYRFCVNHVVEPDDPYEMFPTDYINVDG